MTMFSYLINFGLRTILLCFFTVVGASADDSVTNKQLEAILSELRLLRGLIENQGTRGTRAVPTNLLVELGDSPYLGSKDASAAIIQFTDYECGYCRQFQQQTFLDLKKNYIDSGKVRYYVLNLPLERHANALLAAEAARCAIDQGGFWALHDRMQLADELSLSHLMALAKEAQLDSDALGICLKSERYRRTIQEESKKLVGKGVQGTPSFVIGRVKDGRVDGELVVGAAPFGIFEAKLRTLLGEKSPQ